MKLTNLKINGIRNPMGYLMESVRASCVVYFVPAGLVQHAL